jgi:hypothetical protein
MVQIYVDKENSREFRRELKEWGLSYSDFDQRSEGNNEVYSMHKSIYHDVYELARKYATDIVEAINHNKNEVIEEAGKKLIRNRKNEIEREVDESMGQTLEKSISKLLKKFGEGSIDKIKNSIKKEIDSFVLEGEEQEKELEKINNDMDAEEQSVEQENEPAENTEEVPTENKVDMKEEFESRKIVETKIKDEGGITAGLSAKNMSDTAKEVKSNEPKKPEIKKPEAAKKEDEEDKLYSQDPLHKLRDIKDFLRVFSANTTGAQLSKIIRSSDILHEIQEYIEILVEISEKVK